MTPADFQYVGCWVGYDSRRLPSAVGGASSSPWEPIPPRPLNPGDLAVGARSSVESRSLLGVRSVGCPCHKLGGFGVLHGCDFSAGIDGSASSRCFRWLGEFYPVVDLADFAAGDQGFRWVDIQVSAQVSSQGCCWVISSSAAYLGGVSEIDFCCRASSFDHWVHSKPACIGFECPRDQQLEATSFGGQRCRSVGVVVWCD
ncbi:unnamed protein product [Phytophthora fragariaefolia]|uniref:Unnamed protein product n=1 Tax=Phytophthora fragariaefolia TaxID=1490495 RepID=A0A9W6YMP4_9STRA|nr:unnamed protein product [Phytophthora fragariaefolia]